MEPSNSALKLPGSGFRIIRMASTSVHLILVVAGLAMNFAAGQFCQKNVTMFVFESFDCLNDRHLKCEGDTISTTKGQVNLTRRETKSWGRLMYKPGIRFMDPVTSQVASFSTNFTFSMKGETFKPGEGLAFVMQSVPEFEGYGGGFLGIYNKNGKAGPPTVAIEFDTNKNWFHGFFLYNDINSNHVGLDIDSINSNIQVDAGSVGIVLSKELTVTAWIDYQPATASSEGNLQVRISNDAIRPISALLSYDLDLSKHISEVMYLGFSATTADYWYSNHNILSWSFNSWGLAPHFHPPPPLPPSSFPPPPSVLPPIPGPTQPPGPSPSMSIPPSPSPEPSPFPLPPPLLPPTPSDVSPIPKPPEQSAPPPSAVPPFPSPVSPPLLPPSILSPPPSELPPIPDLPAPSPSSSVSPSVSPVSPALPPPPSIKPPIPEPPETPATSPSQSVPPSPSPLSPPSSPALPPLNPSSLPPTPTPAPTPTALAIPPPSSVSPPTALPPAPASTPSPSPSPSPSSCVYPPGPISPADNSSTSSPSLPPAPDSHYAPSPSPTPSPSQPPSSPSSAPTPTPFPPFFPPPPVSPASSQSPIPVPGLNPSSSPSTLPPASPDLTPVPGLPDSTKPIIASVAGFSLFLVSYAVVVWNRVKSELRNPLRTINGHGLDDYFLDQSMVGMWPSPS